MANNDSHSASTILDDIINELKLSYDSSVGLLDGDAVREIPGTNILLNLSKIFNTLSKELHEANKVDNNVINFINDKLGVDGQDGVDDNDQGDLALKGVKRNRADSEKNIDGSNDINDGENADNDSDEHDDDPLIKRRKPSEVNTKDEPDTKDNENDSKPSHANGSKQNGDNEVPPPVQTGSFSHDNDTRLKNPKSEFVESQTLSSSAISELGLFSEDNNGLETQGKEYLKKKFGVASYPDTDLKDLLPGEYPNTDFSKVKAPSNQVQFTTFQSYIESFYRNFLNDDLKFLSGKHVLPPNLDKQNYDPYVSPYIIPKLGQFYADAWADDDASLASKLNSPAYQQPSADTYKPKGSVEDLSDEKLYTEDVSCGPLSSRLLSAILSVHEGPEDENEDDNDDQGGIKSEGNELGEDDVATKLGRNDDTDMSTEISDFHSVEERLKRELKYIGIFMNLPNDENEGKSKVNINGRPIKTESRSGSIIDSDDWIKNKEDDEVSAEIRTLQKELKTAAARNRLNKKKLIPIVEEQIAYQEYCTILEDLDKQVDQAFMKRMKSRGKKKKNNNEKSEVNPAQQQAMNAGLRSLLDKRKRWINNIGKLFKPPEIMKRIPETSVLEGGNIEEEEVEEENDVAEDVIQGKE